MSPVRVSSSIVAPSKLAFPQRVSASLSRSVGAGGWCERRPSSANYQVAAGWTGRYVNPKESEVAGVELPGAPRGTRRRGGPRLRPLEFLYESLNDNGPLAEMRVTDDRGWALFFSSHVPLAFRGRTKVSRPLNVPEPVIPW
jgi:hypothetical protein